MPQGEVVRSWIRCRSQCARNLCLLSLASLSLWRGEPSAPPFYFLPSAPENEEISFLIPVSYALTPTLIPTERKFTKYFAVVLPEAIAVDSSAR